MEEKNIVSGSISHRPMLSAVTGMKPLTSVVVICPFFITKNYLHSVIGAAIAMC